MCWRLNTMQCVDFWILCNVLTSEYYAMCWLLNTIQCVDFWILCNVLTSEYYTMSWLLNTIQCVVYDQPDSYSISKKESNTNINSCFLQKNKHILDWLKLIYVRGQHIVWYSEVNTLYSRILCNVLTSEYYTMCWLLNTMQWVDFWIPYNVLTSEYYTMCWLLNTIQCVDFWIE
jgi:hypothetical protein